VPLYHWRGLAELKLPKGCSLVGIEILDEAQDLPSFPHPLRAAYVLGPERGVLSPALTARCQHILRILAAFSLNVATAGAIVMYDRVRSLGRFAACPVAEHAEPPHPALHVQGEPRKRRRRG
jgi:tRNA G18 (ribose-2'-O)-methylase SpoU